MATIKANNHLAHDFYVTPHLSRQTMTLEQFQETMLYTEGEFVAVGHVWDIKAKRLAPKVYLVTAKQRYS